MSNFEWGWFDLGWLLLLLDLIIVAALIPTIILQRRESGATLAWILIILLVPFLGLFTFWVFGTTRLHLRRRKRRKIEKRLEPALSQLLSRSEKPEPGVELPLSFLHLAEKLDQIGPQPGNDVELYREGVLAFDALESAFNAAKHHIHLIYYIWESDRTGQRMRDSLAAAADRGVEIRLLIDDVGSRRVKGGFFRRLEEAGAEVEHFLPVNPLSRQLALNNRNHRKIVVVDGRIGFTGGMNVGDLYAGLSSPWLDLHARIEGPVVHSLQEIFCQDWYHARGDDLVNPEYFPDIPEVGKIWAQILASGPADERWRAIHTFLFAAMTLAHQRIWIETPYFVPDAPLFMALQTAALRGVDVRLLLPGKSDHPLVRHAGHSFMDDLLSAGVRIFELHEAMLHAKTATVDGVFSTIGSANMDQRSFRLNFEANAFFFGSGVATELERDFLHLCGRAVEVTEDSRRNLKRGVRLIEGISRVLAPIL